MDHKPKSSSRIPTFLLILVFTGVLFFPASAWWNHYQTKRLKEDSNQLLKAEKWAAAEETARKWTVRAPDNSDAWLALAEACRKQNQFAETADALGRLSDSDPRILKALALKTDLLLSELHDPIKTIETCNRMLKIDPKVDLARQRLIYIYSMMLLRLKMVDQIRQAINLNCEPPEAYVYLLLSDSLNFSNGAPLINSWLQNYPDNEDLQVAMAIYIARSSSNQSLRLKDSQLISGGDQSLISNCLKKYPQNREVLAYFLEKSLEEGNLDRVAELFESAPDDVEQDSRFWRFKSRYLALNNQLDLAEESYRQALKLNPYDWRARLGLAEILRRKGKVSEAKKMARLGSQGKAFSKQLKQLENANSINRELLQEIGQYAHECGDIAVETAIQNRLSKSP
ncbi:tetratricopeptide repeat protein [Gimesia aquarii]|uniref:Tetratricopeptide repeat protein n=1 Tax=Gimesia aquarii TaxID=2527964 RepID=A0A517X258_9PLAN|nr:tetratricopeptide repeat protein [Gimesia aquarii]QDU11586.1 Tetratricopeptide repeat protein [Gimesia aquarii]